MNADPAAADDVTGRYVELCRSSPAAAKSAEAAFSRLAAANPNIALPRPLFVSHERMSRISSGARRLVALYEKVLARCFAGDIDGFLRAQGLPKTRREVIRENLVGEHYYYGRPDVILTSDGFRFVELNVGSELGGYHVGEFNEVMLAEGEFASFAASEGLWHVDPRDVLINRLREVSRRVVGAEDPVVALVEESSPQPSGVESITKTLRARGLRVVQGDLRDISTRHGKIVIHGDTEVDVVLRYFFATHLMDNQHDRQQAALLTKAHLNGHTALFTPMDSALYESKANLGLLYHDAIWRELSSAERSFVRSVVPRTRLLGSDFAVVSPAERKATIDECRQRRQDLVLKPATGQASRGVQLGAAMTDREWHTALQDAEHGDYLVQDRVVPLDEQVINPADMTLEKWHATLGVFCDGEGFGGVRVMGQRADRVGIFGWGIKRYGCLFVY